MKLGTNVLLVAMTWLAACSAGSYQYQKAGATPQQVEADVKACQEYQLRRWGQMGGDYVENMDRDEFEKPCMEQRGYKQVPVSSR